MVVLRLHPPQAERSTCTIVPSHHFRYHLFIYETARTSERLVAGSWCSTRPCARMVETCDRSRSGAPISAIIRAPDSRTCPGWRESARPCALVRSRVQVQRQEAGSAADSNAVEAEAYLSSGPSADTDISLVLHQLPVVTPEVASRFGAPPADAFTIAPALVQPTSKGSVRLASNNFQDAAVIDGNYLGTDQDFAAIVRRLPAFI